VEIRPFDPSDAPALATLSAGCARAEADFVLNPYWESEQELFAEFARFGIAPEQHLLVADAGDGEVLGLVGFLRHPGATEAGLCCPVVKRGDRGRGVGGRLLREAQALAREHLGIELVSAGIGTRNRPGYSLLTSLGFRAVRQHVLMRCDARPVAVSPALPGLEIREACEQDAEEILTLYTTCEFEPRSLERMRGILADGRHTHAVTRIDGRLVAFAELETHWARRVWVAYVGVDPALRNRGLGSSLVAAALGWRFDAGAVSGLLLLSPGNRTAMSAYGKVGFRRHRLFDVLLKKL
jgi:ribosomal protein S18 acetylase RimI-like enzyme